MERLNNIHQYVEYSSQIPGWTRGDEALALARTCFDLPHDATVVELGTFLGSSAVLLAGARKLAGSGRVHCVDPFDASGEPYSAPVYESIAAEDPTPLRARFDGAIGRAGLTEWIDVHQGTAEAVAKYWSSPIDLLFMDADQSPAGVRSAYESWEKFLKDGGMLAVHNSNDRQYDESHDGHRRLVTETVKPPRYIDVLCIGTTTFAKKCRTALTTA